MLRLRLVAAILAVVLVCVSVGVRPATGASVSRTTLTLRIGSSNMAVNGSTKAIDSQKSKPFIRNSRTFVPIRAIVESVGGSVKYDATTQRVDLQLKPHSVRLWIGKTSAEVDGRAVPIDASSEAVVPVIVSGRTYLPLRFTAESLGGDVQWTAATSTITLAFLKRTLHTVKEIADLRTAVAQASVVLSDGGAYATAFFVSADGKLVTNYHVIENGLTAQIETADGKKYSPTVLGYDIDLDLALLKVDRSSGPYLTLGNSDSTDIGDAVVAIGNPLGLENTVSTGIISGKREFYLQTSTPITHGSSGGPLLNMYGEVVGVTTSGAGEADLNFAVGVNELKTIVLGDTMTVADVTRKELVGVPTLYAPASGASVDTRTPRFQWSATDKATKYRIWIGRPGWTGNPAQMLVEEIVTGTFYIAPSIFQNGTSYIWQVTAGNTNGWGEASGAWIFKMSVTLPAPTLVSPIDDPVLPTLTPTLSWKQVEGATKYRVRVWVAQAGPENAVPAEVAGTSYTIPQGTLTSGTRYGWSVAAGDSVSWSAWATLANSTYAPAFTAQLMLPAPVFVSPASGSKVTTLTPTLTWQTVPGATKYFVRIWVSPNGPPYVLERGLDNTTTFQVPAGVLSSGVTYGWAVWAGNDELGWSRLSSKTSDGKYAPSFNCSLAFEKPVLLLPAAGAFSRSETPELSWKPVPGATRYLVWLGGQYSYPGMYDGSRWETTSTQFTLAPGAVELGKSYYWAVAAGDAAGWQGWSDRRALGIGLATPVPISPLTGQDIRTNTPKLIWQAVLGATQYIVRVSPGYSDAGPHEWEVTGTSFTIPGGFLPGGSWTVDSFTWTVASSDGTIQSAWATKQFCAYAIRGN